MILLGSRRDSRSAARESQLDPFDGCVSRFFKVDCGGGGAWSVIGWYLKTEVLLVNQVLHLGVMIDIGTEDVLDSTGLFEQLGHGPGVVEHVFLRLFHGIERPGQMIAETNLNLQSTQSTIVPTNRSNHHQIGMRKI